MNPIRPRSLLENWWSQSSSQSVEEQIVQGILDLRNLEPQFLSPSLKEIPDPFLLLNLRASLELFWKTWQAGEKVLLVGDYDVDGITSTALMLRFLKRLGPGQLDWFIPNRLVHGYGLTEKAVGAVLEKQPKLIITLDNGIAAGKEIQMLKEQGVETIVTDHHQPQPDLLPSCLIVNPKLEGSLFPDKNPSGVGVAFLWLLGLRAFLREQGFWQGEEPNMLEQLDLVALGTIADQVPLLGLNRIFAKFGLEQMTSKLHAPDAGPGFYYLRAFGDKLKLTTYDPRSLAFRLAPLLNATGRIGDAGEGLCFLTSPELTACRDQLKKIAKINNQRKSKQDKMVSKARDLALKEAEKGGLIIYDAEFHEGLIGIIAHRLLDEYGLPTGVFTLGEAGMVKGSLRSKGINLMELLKPCDPFLRQWGGHANAAGCTLDLDQFASFAEAFNQACLQAGGGREDEVLADLEVLPHMLSFRLIDLLRKLEPFGKEHDPPLFFLKRPQLPQPKIMAGKHLKWDLGQDLEIVYWGGVEKVPRQGADLAVTLTGNEFLGRWRRQLIVQAVSGAN